jgi:hypothetical protein
LPWALQSSAGSFEGGRGDALASNRREANLWAEGGTGDYDMKMRYCLLFSLPLWAAPVSARAQGSFQNLGFESATLVPAGFHLVQFAPAFPGWSGYIGGVQETLAVYNNVYLDTSGIAIIDRGWTNSLGQYGSVIEGNYTAVLMAGVVNGLNDPEDVTLSQTSLVPASVQSLWFKAQLDGPFGFLQVTLGGERLSLLDMGSGTNYTLYAADIHSFAGQTAELDFTAFAQRPHIGDNYVFLDAIQFSDQPIPEPGVAGLWALGILLVAWRRR